MPFFLRLRRSCSHNSSGTSTKEWCVLLSVTIVLPFVITYLHLYHFLHIQQCVVYNRGQSEKVNDFTKTEFFPDNIGIYCQQPSSQSSSRRSFRLFSLKKDFYGVPPSIATLAPQIETSRWTEATMDVSTIEDSLIAWDYSSPVWTSLTKRFWNAWTLTSMTDPTGSSSSRNDNQVKITAADAKLNKYGYRSNRNNRVSRHPRDVSSTSLPLATYFWMTANIGLFLLYWQRRVPISKVALNGQLLSSGDLGRALTGNLAHFEIWHLGLNMISTSSLGSNMALEGSLGTIPLFLLTTSWIPLTTMVVVALQWIKTRWLSHEGTTASNTTSLSTASAMVSSFPNMVGFSGILFAWMVVATLQTQQKSCPVFFLPDLCFDVYQIGGFTVSLGPLVQLVVLQLVLPRASFVGHLAGIVIGFLFHWRVQPPLEWSQPCVVFPMAWFLGKLLSLKCFGWSSSGDTMTNDGGQALGGGGTLARIAVTWRTSIQTDHSNSQDDLSVALWCLAFLRGAVAVHTMLLLCTCFLRNPFNSMVASGFVLAALLTSFENAGRSKDGKTKLFGRDFTGGMLGRAVVVMVLVQCITDSMTLAGWMVTSPAWHYDSDGSSFRWMLLLLLWTFRIVIWIVILLVICHVLNLVGELQRNGEISVWSHALDWWVVKPCTSAGKLVLENLRERNTVMSDVPGLESRDSPLSSQMLRGRVASEVV